MKITFVKSGERYLISMDDKIVPFNEENFGKVRSQLSLPTSIYFHNCPFDFLGKVVANLFDENTDLNVKRINRDGESLDYEASFTIVKELPGVGLK